VTPGRAELPADIARLLKRLRDGLAARGDLVGVYLYGSLATGDFSPAKKIRRAQLTRRIVKRGADRLSRLEPTTPHEML
jgi:hypothetical protein